jgi:uncharacterized protein DUF6790
MSKYTLSIVLLLLVLPVASIFIEYFADPRPHDVMWLVGKWFTFWGCGVRLFVAGVTQVLKPQFTARSIFNLDDPAAYGLVREVGFGNLSFGAIGLVSVIAPSWLVPAAVAGGMYYGLAGLGHLMRPERNTKEQVALVSDLLIAALLAVFVIDQAVRIFA